MKTTTFQDILFAAAEFATRTRDQIPSQEYVSGQGFIAAEVLRLWTLREWPELIPPLQQVQCGPLNGVGNQFSKNVGEANEIGDILGIYLHNPQQGYGGGYGCGAFRWHRGPVGYYEGVDNDADPIVWVETHHNTVWVESMVPYPSTAWPDLTQMTTATFLAALCPLRFRNILAHKAAAHLFGADMGAPFQAAQMKLGEMELANEILRLPTPPPWRRTISLSFPRKRW